MCSKVPHIHIYSVLQINNTIFSSQITDINEIIRRDALVLFQILKEIDKLLSPKLQILYRRDSDAFAYNLMRINKGNKIE